MAEAELFHDGRVTLYPGDCLATLDTLPENSIDSVVCDPPYHLTSIVKRFGGEDAAPAQHGTDGAFSRASRGFMGKQWDGGDIAFRVDTWAKVLRVLKPGGYVLAFSSSRTFGRMAVAIEDAGFVTHPMIGWVFSTGFPKATRIKAEGYEGQRYGAQSLKPALEPIYMGQKPFSEDTGTANILRWGTGAVRIDDCRIEAAGGSSSIARRETARSTGKTPGRPGEYGHTIVNRISADAYTADRPGEVLGRWPANLIHDGSPEVVALFPESNIGGDAKNGSVSQGSHLNICGDRSSIPGGPQYGDCGSAARFFYQASASQEELIFWRAKAILAIWNSEIARTADSFSYLSKEAVASALRDAAISACHAANAPTIPGNFQGLSTSATPKELRRISEAVITATMIIAEKCWRAWQHERPILNGSLVKCAEVRERTGIITTTISHWRSDGSADPVTFDFTPLNLVHGEAVFSVANRLHYQAKADSDDRLNSKHPTVKPLDLIRYLVRLVTPKGGLVLDCFAGTGTTGHAALIEGCRAILCERETEYCDDIRRRMTLVYAGQEERRGRLAARDTDLGPLFAGAAE